MLGDMWALQLGDTDAQMAWEPVQLDAKAAKPGASSGHTCVAMGQRLVCFGGYLALGAGTVWAFDARARVWEEHRPANARAPAPQARMNHTAVALGGEMLVFGGFIHQWHPCCELWWYNLASNTWAQKPLQADSPVPPARYDHAACRGDDGCMYIVGGLDTDSHVLDDCWRFDPVELRWELLGHSPSPARRSAQLTAGLFIIIVIKSM